MVEFLVLKRLRATSNFVEAASAEILRVETSAPRGDEISTIQDAFDGILSYQRMEKKKRSEIETSLESIQIREARSVANAQAEIHQVKSLIQATRSGVITLDRAGWILSCDELAAQRLGEEPAVIIHQPLRAFLRRETSSSDQGVLSVSALNDWPSGSYRCRVVSATGEGDAVDVAISDADHEHRRRIVLVRDAGDEQLRQELRELAKVIEETVGPTDDNLGSLRDRLAVLREYVSGLESDKQLVVAALDRVPVALALVDNLGNIRHLNHAAKTIVGAKDGLTSVRGRLVAARPQEQAQLQQRLNGLLGQRTDNAAGWAALQVGRESGTPWLVLLTSLRSAATPRVTASTPPDLVIVMITDPLQPVRASAAVLQQLHGLTPAEAEVLGRLTDGMRLSDIAEDLDVSIETVRSQLKSIFSKTGTSRQADLVRYALLGGAWIHGTELPTALTDRARGNRTQQLEGR